MRISSLIFLASLTSTAAFVPHQHGGGGAFRRIAALGMSTDRERIVITGNNIELTDSLNDYVNKKLDRVLGKLTSSGEVHDCDVHLSVNKNPKVKNGHRIEVTTKLKGLTLRTTEETPDMYASIDAVADRMQRKLRKYKERRLDGHHGGKQGMSSDFLDALEALEPEEPPTPAPEEEEFEDPFAPTVTKIKSFDLGTPISLKEAVFALDYVDHDFYVFRNEETDEINVVYKRNAGGVGLIQPAP